MAAVVVAHTAQPAPAVLRSARDLLDLGEFGQDDWDTAWADCTRCFGKDLCTARG